MNLIRKILNQSSTQDDREFYSAMRRLLKFSPNQLEFYQKAFTHRSLKKVDKNGEPYNYERLEFLGDRVLGLVLAEFFFKLFPDANEGLLNNYLQRYANQNALAEYAIKINLSDFIKFQKGDNLELNISVLSDVVESVIASIYLDTGFNSSKNFIINEIIDIDLINSEPTKHPKSLLQEYCLNKYKFLPKYTIIDKTGTDHKTIFKVSVSIDKINKVVSEGSSLKNAEEAAALKLLGVLKI